VACLWLNNPGIGSKLSRASLIDHFESLIRAFRKQGHNYGRPSNFKAPQPY